MLIDVKKTERIEHPEEAGAWVEIRPLLATELDTSRKLKIKEILDMWGDALDGASRSTRQVVDDLASRVQQFDAISLLKAIVAWSYDEPVNAENIARLDGATRDWVIEEVVKRNTRPLLK